jgi:hypothetical protein
MDGLTSPSLPDWFWHVSLDREPLGSPERLAYREGNCYPEPVDASKGGAVAGFQLYGCKLAFDMLLRKKVSK